MEEKKKSPKKVVKPIKKIGDKLFNAKEFCTLSKLNVRESFWVAKKYGSLKISGFEWSEKMISEKVISEVPEIFNLKQSRS